MAAPLLEPARPATIRLAFAPNPVSVRTVSTAIRNFLSEHGVPETELYSYELCIAEAGNNAVEYAQGSSRALEPVAEALFTPAQIELRVTDHTAGFVLPDRIPTPSPLKERGRGLFVIQSAMDEVRYLRGATENILVMRKKRRSLQTPGHERGSVRLLSLEECRNQLAEARSATASMADELAYRNQTLNAVLRSCAELVNCDEDDLRGRLLTDLLRIVSADWYVLRLLSPDGLKLVIAASSDQKPAFELSIPPLSGQMPQSIELSVAQSRAPARFDTRTCAEKAEPLRVVGAGATGLVCPMCSGGTLVGTVAIGRRAGEFPLRKVQEEMVGTFAEFLATQTLNHRRRRDEMRHRVVERELEIARDIQRIVLPRTLPQPAGFGLAGGWQSAREVGGDFYDAVALDGQSLLLIIADVMGKGVPSVLFATTMRGLLRGLAAHNADPGRVLSGLNRQLFPELSSVNMFITAQVVHVDLKARRITAAGAGHCPVLFVAPKRGPVSALATKGLPIGVMPETAYRNATAHLGSPAALFMHTDGLPKVRNTGGEAFSQRRLRDWMTANIIAGRSAGEVRDHLTVELNRFRGGAPMADDQAFLLLVEDTGPAMQAAPKRGRRGP